LGYGGPACRFIDAFASIGSLRLLLPEKIRESQATGESMNAMMNERMETTKPNMNML
jgi:hypothetical protein